MYLKLFLPIILFHYGYGGIRMSKTTVIRISSQRDTTLIEEISQNDPENLSLNPRYHGNYRRLKKPQSRVATIHPRPGELKPKQQSMKRCIAQTTVLEFMKQENATAHKKKRIVRY